METNREVLDYYLDEILRLEKLKNKADGFANEIIEIPIEEINLTDLRELEIQIKKMQTCDSVISYVKGKMTKETKSP